MTTTPAIDQLFDRRIALPDVEARERLHRLVGLENHKTRLAKMLGLLINPSGLNTWVNEHHPRAIGVLDTVLRRPPLVVLAGDVGSGKTELAETIGDEVARREGVKIMLFPMSLSTRGQGRVGEMTQLLSAAFDHVEEEALERRDIDGSSRGAVLLLVDEADAIAQSREAAQMHHEDRAGVNAFIRGVDRLANRKLPAAVIMCTNRLGALDPAVQRRAADILTFRRPSSEQRVAVLSPHLRDLGFSQTQVAAIVAATGPRQHGESGFTFSDLTQRLIPAIVLDAYPDGPVDAERALKITQEMTPTAPFRDGAA